MSSSERLQVIAVVLNWCTEAESRACVTQLLREPILRVVVVDNDSPDGSGERLKDWVDELRQGPLPGEADIAYLQTGANLGYAGGNARGIEWALANGADWVLVINPDVVPEPGLVDALLTAGALPRTGRIGAVCPTLLQDNESGHATYAGGRFDVKRALGEPVTGVADAVAPRDASPREITFFHGGCVLLRAEALRDVGAFREDFFMYVEDAELSLRLHRAGWVMLHQPKARVVHAGDESGDPVAWKIALRDRNRRRLVAQHYRLAEQIRFWLWFYPSRVVHALRYLLQADLERAGAVLRATFGSMERQRLENQRAGPNR